MRLSAENCESPEDEDVPEDVEQSIEDEDVPEDVEQSIEEDSAIEELVKTVSAMKPLNIN